MLDSLRRRLSPGTVLGTIALFVALGGGYATAFSGSGSLQKQGATSCPTEFTDFRQLNGFGYLQLKFDTSEDPDELQVRFRNTSPSFVSATFHPWKEQPNSGQVAQPGAGITANSTQSVPFIINETGPTTADFHLFKSVGGGDQIRQQVVGQVHASIGTGTCDSPRVLALNTNE